MGAGSQASLRETLARCPAVQNIESMLKRVTKIAQREPISPMLMDRLISPELALKSSALKMLNFNQDSPVATLSDSCARHGLDATREAVLTALAYSVSVTLTAKSGFPALPLTLQALASGTIVRFLISEDEYPLLPASALLSNIGVGVLAAIHGTTYLEITAQLTGTVIPLHEAERYAFRVDHAEVGSILLADVGFGAEIVEPILGQAISPGQDRSMGSVLSLAGVLAHQMGFDGGVPNTPLELSPSVKTKFSLTDEKLGEMLLRVTDEISRFTTTLPKIEQPKARAA